MTYDHTGNPEINIDLIVRILKTSVFHYSFGVVAIVILKAFELPWQHPWTRFFLYYTAFLLAVHGLSYALRPRGRVDWREQVVVITGGAGGLGNCLAEALAMRGADVAVLDVTPSTSHLGQIRHYVCDIGDPEQIKAAAEQIRAALGAPTMLVNNAGVVHPNLITNATVDEVRHTFEVNTLAHFWTVREFLPAMLQADRGHVVTVASLLGCVGVGGLTAYCSSKGAAVLFHESLQHELDLLASKVRTVLVCPGHLTTAMFAMLKTANQFLLPLLTPTEVAQRIIEAIEDDVSVNVYMPWGCQFGHLYTSLPSSLKSFIRKHGGVDASVRGLVCPSDEDRQ
ncbi:short-chain dehydrogenase/reductase-like protein [Syncephalis pseudoplumigaleata]|uniref:Short-chain dehydrogenase/reductase 3 n=1 Tax=Syncephalis pseudoplumigaleata TaxID=1712513 RepID=A0A4P9YXT2_9FUNG|nr:short-chain dehydrogenase/reductase-like protein [Syncephalis pseudoplumigaleata]|eukprot:RKP24877.1 short-chain dehydrogenase/reductase-like protein [Syncephalis pseudoplumigaleata]